MGVDEYLQDNKKLIGTVVKKTEKVGKYLMDDHKQPNKYILSTLYEEQSPSQICQKL